MTEPKKNIGPGDDEEGLANLSLNSSRRPASMPENDTGEASADRRSEPVPAPAMKVPDQQKPKP